MPSAELLKKIRRIEIYTNRLVTSVLGGGYLSVFKGQGMEFMQVREYEPGDDVRTIDWNVTARMNRPFVKQYVEERELTVLLLVDVSSSAYFGTVQQFKRELAAEFCASIAFSALRNNDRVGLLLFTERVERVIPPKKGRRHILRLIRELLHYAPTQHGTDLAAALDYAGHLLTRRSTIFLVSDFLAPDFTRALKQAQARHDVIAVTLTDPRERQLPPVGVLKVEDAETGAGRWVDTRSRRAREEYRRQMEARRAQLAEIFRSSGVDAIHLQTGESFVEPLMEFFLRRKRRLAHG
jgi:uncharacterized protein (DUF58 family)